MIARLIIGLIIAIAVIVLVDIFDPKFDVEYLEECDCKRIWFWYTWNGKRKNIRLI